MPYATPDDLPVFGTSAAALKNVTTAVQLQHLDAASRQLDVWLSLGGYTTPLSSWGTDLTRWTCEIAAYTIAVQTYGYNPDGSSKLLKDRADEAEKKARIAALLGDPSFVDGT